MYGANTILFVSKSLACEKPLRRLSTFCHRRKSLMTLPLSSHDMADSYHVFVGAETGLLKGLNATKNRWDNLIDLSSVDRSNEVCVMCWEQQRQENSLLFGTRGGLIRKYCRNKQSVEDILQLTQQNDEVIKGLYKLDSKYVTCTNKGKLRVLLENMNSDDPDESVVDCGDGICCMNEDPYNLTRVATGGKENCLKIFDLNRLETGSVFKSKNVRDDWLDLRVPIWVTAIGYMPRSSSSLVVTTTAYHQIRVYDTTTAQKRPVIDMEWEEYPIVSLCVSPFNDRQLMVGNAVGEQALLDVRNKRCLGKFKGGAGAIRSIQCHPTLPLVVSCGLDRYVRIHDMNTRVLTNKFYMKSRLNTLLLTSNWEDEVEKEEIEIKDEPDVIAGEAEAEEAEEADELWASLNVVGDTTKTEVQTTKKTQKRSKKPEGLIVETTKNRTKKRKSH